MAALRKLPVGLRGSRAVQTRLLATLGFKSISAVAIHQEAGAMRVMLSPDAARETGMDLRMVENRPRTRDATATKARILVAAKEEFARLGLAGARVDEIADKAKSNKRMIYHYFGSKEDLFAAVLEDAYLDIRGAEQSLDLESLPPRDALEKLVRFTWEYYLDRPEFIRLVNSENLHKARHIDGSARLQDASRRFTGLVGDILRRGEQEGVFRAGIDPVQLNITIAAIGYYYLTNRFTGAFLFERDFMSDKALDERLKFNIDTVMRLVELPQ